MQLCARGWPTLRCLGLGIETDKCQLQCNTDLPLPLSRAHTYRAALRGRETNEVDGANPHKAGGLTLAIGGALRAPGR